MQMGGTFRQCEKANGGPWLAGTAVRWRGYAGIRGLGRVGGSIARARQSPAVPPSLRMRGVTKMISSLLSSRTEVVLNSQLR